jgi:hypothetical protein
MYATASQQCKLLYFHSHNHQFLPCTYQLVHSCRGVIEEERTKGREGREKGEEMRNDSLGGEGRGWI